MGLLRSCFEITDKFKLLTRITAKAVLRNPCVADILLALRTSGKHVSILLVLFLDKRKICTVQIMRDEDASKKWQQENGNFCGWVFL